MTIRKEYPPRDYETFPGSDGASNATHPTQGGDADKSRSAAEEAQRLASEGSWFTGGTPATDRTPAASTVDGEEVRSVGYPHLTQDADPSDPPPEYTPSASTQAPSSPVAARSEPVSAPAPVSCPSHPSSSHPIYRDGGEDDGPSSSFPEPCQHQHTPREDEDDVEEDIDPESLPVFMHTQRRGNCSKKRWCGPRPSARRGCRAGGHGPGRGRRWGCHDKERVRRFKRTCFFIFALAACLWLMIPALCKSLSNDGRYQLPNVGSEPSKPSEKPWPPPDREHRERETSGTITGTFKLYDLLDLSTTSGSIFITVDVQSGDKPAVLRLATTSGSIRVKMSSGGGLFRKPYLSDTVQTRRLISDISTQSGSVSGDVVHGNGGSTSISTKSGSIHLTVYTAGVSELDAPSSLATSTGSGSQLIKVVPPFGSTEAVRAIEASHTVHGSGSVSLQYPTEWEGMLHAQIHGSGSLTASGAGLDVRRESRKELYAYKGSKQGRTVEVVEFGSGSVRFSC